MPAIIDHDWPLELVRIASGDLRGTNERIKVRSLDESPHILTVLRRLVVADPIRIRGQRSAIVELQPITFLLTEVDPDCS
jgi:hypothetical protein